MKNPIHIVICDDEQTAISIISASVEALLTSRSVGVTIEKFTSASECVEYLRQRPVDLVFLDLSMPEMDGLELARAIRQMQDPALVFVSSQQERVFDTFEVEPFGFVRKDRFMQDISALLNRYLDTVGDKEPGRRFLEINGINGVTLVEISQITYIESFRNKQVLHQADGSTKDMHTTMETLMAQLKPFGFLRVHKGYLVACAHIRHFGRTEVELITRERLPVGRTNYHEAMEGYMAYIRRSGIAIT